MLNEFILIYLELLWSSVAFFQYRIPVWHLEKNTINVTFTSVYVNVYLISIRTISYSYQLLIVNDCIYCKYVFERVNDRWVMLVINTHVAY